jgi:hypothetical protein
MSAVVYGNNALVPAPFVAISKEIITKEDGTPIAHTYAITLKGKLLAWKGSPGSSGAFWQSSGYPPDEVIQPSSMLAAILEKQSALRNLFATEGQSLEIQPYDGSQPFKCNPRVKRIDFPEGQWFNEAEYVITLEADWVDGMSDADYPPQGLVNKVADEWNIEILDEKIPTYRLTHAVSAVGKRVFDETGALLNGKQAWENAKDYVLNTTGLGLDTTRMQAPGVLNASTLQAYNYIRSNQVNEDAGVFASTESWVCYDPQGQPPAIHEYTVSVHYSLNDNRTTATVEGTVTGLEVRDNQTRSLTSTRWQNGSARWNGYIAPYLLSTAQANTGLTLNPIATNSQVGSNQVAGTVNYHFEFDNRPVPSTPGAISEIITIVNNHAADVFAQIPVLGRPFGPVLQSIGTVTAKKRAITIEIVMPPTTMSFTSSPPNTDGIVLGLVPQGALAVFLEQDDEQWTERTGRYSRTTSFVWE